MAWRIEFRPSAARELRRLDRPTQRRILTFFENRIAAADDPRQLGKALRGAAGEFWRYRVGDYRIICRIEDEALSISIVRLGHRREVYR